MFNILRVCVISRTLSSSVLGDSRDREQRRPEGSMERETSDYIVGCLPRSLRAAAVLAGGAICMSSLSIVYSFGNLLPYLVSYLHIRVDPSITAGSLIWLQTLLSGVPFSMLIGGVAESSVGGRTAAFVGCFLYTMSISVSSILLKWSYGWLLLSFGLLPSFGQGVAYNAVLVTAQRWFPHRIGVASGVIIAGFGCGTFFIAPLQTAYVNPDKYTVNAEGFFTQDDLLDRVPEVFLVMGICFAALQAIGLLFLAAPSDSLEIDEDLDLLFTRTPPPADLSTCSMLCSSSFAFLFLTLLFSATWVQITSGFYKAYGLGFIPSDHFLSLVASISSIFNCGSRLLWGFIVDKTSYQVTMCISSVVGSILVWCLPLVRHIGDPFLFLITICLIFCCIGGVYTLLPYASSRVFGQEKFGIMYGAIQLSLSLAGVLAGILGQFVLPIIGYDRLFLIVGALPMISFTLTALFHLTPLAQKCIQKRVNRTAEYDSSE